MASKPFTLVIVSHVIHYEHEGRLYAYGPYAREIDIWADLFPVVAIAAPLRRQVPPQDCVPFGRANIEVIPQLETGGDDLSAKLRQLRHCRFMSGNSARRWRGRTPSMSGAPGISVFSERFWHLCFPRESSPSMPAIGAERSMSREVTVCKDRFFPPAGGATEWSPCTASGPINRHKSYRFSHR